MPFRPRNIILSKTNLRLLAAQVEENLRDLTAFLTDPRDTRLAELVARVSEAPVVPEDTDILWSWNGEDTTQFTGNNIHAGSMNGGAATPTLTTTTYEGQKWLRLATTDFRVASSSKVVDAWSIDWEVRSRFTVRFICKRRTTAGGGAPVLLWGLSDGLVGSGYGFGWTLANSNNRIVWEGGGSASAYVVGLLSGLSLNTGDTDMQAVEMHIDLTRGLIQDTSPTFLATSGASFDADVDSSAKGSHTYSAGWDQWTFSQFILGLYGASSTSTTYSIDITDFQIVKHPKDRA